MAASWVLMCCLWLADPSPYFLLTKDGRVLEIVGEPRYEGNTVYFTLKDGEKSMFPLSLVDQSKTEQYNAQYQAKMKAEEEARAAAEASVEPQAQEERKPISITHRTQIPAYQRAQVDVAGQGAEPESEAVEGAVGRPTTRYFADSSDPLFISRETVTRTVNGHVIDCLVKGNEPRGVSDVEVAMTVTLINGATIQMTRRLENRDLGMGDTAPVTFEVETEHDIARLDYSLSAQTGSTLR